jgi:hypothetical protein
VSVRYYSYNEEDGVKTFFIFEEVTHVVPTEHPSFNKILEACRAKDYDKALGLLQEGEKVTEETLTEAFEPLSDRISYKNGKLYIDGDEAPGVLSDQIVRFLKDEVRDGWTSLVKFYEKLLSNPNEHSREQLYRWLATHNFSITAQGDIVGYKFVRSFEEGKYRSTQSGYAIVDGVEQQGYTTYGLGSTVSMPRSMVQHDPKVGCSTGLHVGNWDYVRGNSTILEVHVNPADVVSVPTENNWGKLRTCKLQVVREVTEPYNAAVAGGVKIPALAVEPQRSVGVYSYPEPNNTTVFGYYAPAFPTFDEPVEGDEDESLDGDSCDCEECEAEPTTDPHKPTILERWRGFWGR